MERNTHPTDFILTALHATWIKLEQSNDKKPKEKTAIPNFFFDTNSMG